MNLSKLFETQRKLDERIVKEKGLEGQDLLPEKILALQVELGELANEWRGFKFWSEDRKARTVAYEGLNDGINEPAKNPLLEEYVDCLHFILSIGLDGGVEKPLLFKPQEYEHPSITLQFSILFESVARVGAGYRRGKPQEIYEEMFSEFIYLGEMLGFTWDQIEQAYYEKNRINHERQDGGY